MSDLCELPKEAITKECQGILARAQEVASTYQRERLLRLVEDIHGDLTGYGSITKKQWDVLQGVKESLGKWGK